MVTIQVTRRIRRLAIVLATATMLTAGLALSLGSAALAAPVGTLKQYRLPTADSDPRYITNGSDGNRWFTESSEFTDSPATVGRVTPTGAITEFPVNCNGCILNDIAQGPDDVLYFTSNDPILWGSTSPRRRLLIRYPCRASDALAGDVAIHGNESGSPTSTATTLALWHRRWAVHTVPLR